MWLNNFGSLVRFLLTCFSLILLSGLAVFSAEREGLKLSAEDRDIIRQLELSTGKNFEDFFTRAIHDKELCFPSLAPCSMPLVKFSQNVNIFFKNWYYLEKKESLRSLAVPEVFDVVEILKSETNLGISVSVGYVDFVQERHKFQAIDENFAEVGSPRNWSPQDVYVSMHFVDKDAIELIGLQSFADMTLRSNIFPANDSLVQSFLLGYKSGIPCGGSFVTFPDENEIHFAQIWISVQLTDDQELPSGTKDQITECIREELYNVFGPNEGEEVPSIFDWPAPDGEDPRNLTSFHQLILRLMYLPRFEVGQLEYETFGEIAELLSR